MSELEPDDSRNVTLRNERAPGEPPRTGPREGETRKGPQGQRQSQGGARKSDWRADEAVADREAQDHEQAAGNAEAPSLRPEADDGQWSQQAGEDARQQQPDDTLHGGGDPRQAEQAERGGG